MNKHSRIINLNYFDSYSIENCYWAGFIAADGCIYDKRQQLSIRIQERDFKHLTRFVTDIQCNNKIQHYIQNRFGSKFKMCQFTVGGIPRILQSLQKKFNITSKKTYTLKPPPLNNKKFILPFIVGYIDGDGYVGIRKNKYKNSIYHQRVISIAGTQSILNWINNQFDQIFMLKGKRFVRKIKGSRCYEYGIIGYQSQMVFDALSRLGVPKLSRKWELDVEAK